MGLTANLHYQQPEFVIVKSLLFSRKANLLGISREIQMQWGLCKNISNKHWLERKSRHEEACREVSKEMIEQAGDLPHKAPQTETHHLGRGQHQDDKADLTGVLPPVLGSDQAADAHMPLL